MAGIVPKIDLVRAAIARDDWRGAFSIASKFGRLGPHKAAIMGAWEAYTRPVFQRQLKRDPEALISAGKAAMAERFGK